MFSANGTVFVFHPLIFGSAVLTRHLYRTKAVFLICPKDLLVGFDDILHGHLWFYQLHLLADRTGWLVSLIFPPQHLQGLKLSPYRVLLLQHNWLLLDVHLSLQ